MADPDVLRRKRKPSRAATKFQEQLSIQERAAGSSAAGRRPRNATLPTAPEPLAFDRLIHEQIRLGILSALAASSTLTFKDLKRLLNVTDGNLSVHARKLEEANYIACSKYFAGRVPRTEYRLTGLGCRALKEYLDQMETLIKATRRQ